jgi:hypothetical protein
MAPKRRVLTAEEKEQQKIEKKRKLLQKYSKQLDVASTVNVKIKFCIGLMKLFSQDISSMTVPSSEEDKVLVFKSLITDLYRISTEIHWVETGVQQRPFDKIGAQPLLNEDRKPMAISSIQGFNKYLRSNTDFEDDMSGSSEMVQNEKLVNEFRALEHILFFETVQKIISKLWGPLFNEFDYEWAVGDLGRHQKLTITRKEEVTVYAPEKYRSYRHEGGKQRFFKAYYEQAKSFAIDGPTSSAPVIQNKKVRLAFLINYRSALLNYYNKLKNVIIRLEQTLYYLQQRQTKQQRQQQRRRTQHL